MILTKPGMVYFLTMKNNIHSPWIIFIYGYNEHYRYLPLGYGTRLGIKISHGTGEDFQREFEDNVEKYKPEFLNINI